MRRILVGFAVVLISTVCIAQNTTTLAMNAPRLFERGLNALTSFGASHSEADALDYFHRSADLGYAPAQVVLGYFYDTGTIATQDRAQAAEWYKKAAQQDDALGAWLLGRLIYSGNGQLRDLNEASRWLEKAAAHDNPYGEYLLGQIRLERSDYVKAAELFRKASMQGLPQAQQQLGSLLKQGQGVKQDKLEAYVWLLMSFDAGNQAAAADARQLEGDLATTQIEQAKNKARDLEQTVTRAVVAHGCAGWPGEFNGIPAPPPPDIQSFCR
jgi:TPR repeat protein